MTHKNVSAISIKSTLKFHFIQTKISLLVPINKTKHNIKVNKGIPINYFEITYCRFILILFDLY